MTDETVRERLFEKRAREREEDRDAGRPERGMFTGRGRRSVHDADDEAFGAGRPGKRSPHDREREDEDDEDTVHDRPRVGAKRMMLRAIRQVPAYLKLLYGLMRDSRVSRLDRILVVAAAAYMISPLDFIPDIIPFIGEVDDIFLVVLAVQRLIDHAGRRVLMDHWAGDPDDLSDLNLTGLVSAAGFFLPSGIRRRLVKMVIRN